MFLSRYRVGARLAVGFSLLLIFAAVLTVIGINRMGLIQANLEGVVNSDFARVALVNKMRDAVRFQAIALRDIVMQEDLAFMKKELKLMKEARKAYQMTSEQLKALVSDAQTQAMLDALVTTEAAVKAAMGTVIDLTLEDKFKEAGESAREHVRPAQLELIKKLEALLDLLEAQSRQTADEAKTAYQSAFVSMIAIALTAMVLGVGISVVITRSIVAPLNEAVGIARKTAMGDLTSRIDVRGRDETAQLMTALKDMNTSLGRIISGVKTASDSVAQNASQLSQSMDQAATRAQSQNERIMAASAAVEEMSASIGEISRGAAGVLDAAEQSRGIARDNDKIVEQSTQASQRVVQTVESSGKAVGQLTQSILKINDFTRVINNVADQTNLLALNATIESARAGEHGRGFAVVAAEVRTLSKRTTASTSDIAHMVANVEQCAAEAVTSMSRVTEEVAKGCRLSEITTASMRKISDAADSVSVLAQQIADATREQNGATDEAARNMEQISQLAEQNTENLQQLDAAAGTLSNTSAELRELVEQFKIG